MAGNVIDQIKVQSAGWTTLNASVYPDGIYMMEVFTENNLVGYNKWVVNHR
jgi:hypothetical protein